MQQTKLKKCVVFICLYEIRLPCSSLLYLTLYYVQSRVMCENFIDTYLVLM